MPNIAVVLREEIQRLARRVSRQADRQLKKDVVHLKHQVAEHKRRIAELKRDNAKLLADLKARLSTPPAASEKELENARLSPRLIRAHRTRVGLSREDYAKLLGVSSGAVLNWEGGRSRPRVDARAALIAVRKLGKREARWRLETMSGNGHRVPPPQPRHSVRARRAAR